MSDQSSTSEAKLNRNDDSVVTVQVPAFPGQPDVVIYQGRYYVGGNIGYGVPYLTYHEATYFTPTEGS